MFREVWGNGGRVREFFFQGNRLLDGCSVSSCLFALLVLLGILRPIVGLFFFFTM